MDERIDGLRLAQLTERERRLLANARVLILERERDCRGAVLRAQLTEREDRRLPYVGILKPRVFLPAGS